MNNKKRALFNLILRYILLLFLVILIYFFNFFDNLLLVFTIYPSSWLLGLFYSSAVYKSIIFVNSYAIELIPACIAVSAYVLLLILNLTISMNIERRVKTLLFSFLCLLLFNISRIFIFSLLLVNNYAYFEELHAFFWYFLSIALVVIIWFLTANIFKIKGIPVYNDFKYLKNLSK